MKKFKFSSFILSFLLLGSISFADVNFSGMAGGTAGISGATGGTDEGFSIPFNAFAAAQLNFGTWGIFRANLGLASKNLANGNLFTGQDATLTVNELSLVLVKSAGSIKNYFSFYLGTYEVVGKDEYMQRQFGMDPFTSLVTKNATTLSTGIPLYDNYGTGFSYTMNFANAPGTLGFNLYLNNSSANIPQLNFDIRTAWTLAQLTVDLSAGLTAPMQNQHSGSDVLLLIDSLYVHGGLSLLLGNLYTHSLFIQAGIQNIPIIGSAASTPFSGLQDLSFLVEPRIYTKNLKVRLTAYNLPENTLKDMLYLKDPFGGIITVYSDTIPVKNNNMTLGVHIIGSIKDQDLITFIATSGLVVPNLNAYITPFINLPVANGSLEIMGQIGGCDILNSIYFTFQTKVGYKKAF